MNRRTGRLLRTIRPLKREQWVDRALHELRQRSFRRIPTLLPALIGRPTDEVRVAVQLRPLPSERELRNARRIEEAGRTLLAGHDVKVDGWGDGTLPKLVRYHLHYLDAARDLAVASPVQGPSSLARALELVAQWRKENPVRGGEGWEPYAVAARLQNLSWITGVLGSSAPRWLVELLVPHARYLAAWPEVHLQGNHLLKDWCSLAIASAVLEGPEVSRWRARALAAVERELAEQLLPDGGHYERSAMYHALVLADLLDLRDVTQLREMQLTWLEEAVLKMTRFLVGVTQPDGELPLFNDAVFGQAPSPAELVRRTSVELTPPALFDAPHYGLTVARRGPSEALSFDSGVLGPAHQPGHAHSDTLSFELTVGGQRVVVNGGMDGYQSPRRPHFRSTAAHNTVTVDGEGPDELWASFRVGGRSRLLHRAVTGQGELLLLEGSLRAFAGWTHSRKLVYLPGRALLVLDTIRSPRSVEAEARVRLLGNGVQVEPVVGRLWRGVGLYSPRFNEVSDIAEVGVSGSGEEVRLAMLIHWSERHSGATELPHREGVLLQTQEAEYFSEWPKALT